MKNQLRRRIGSADIPPEKFSVYRDGCIRPEQGLDSPLAARGLLQGRQKIICPFSKGAHGFCVSPAPGNCEECFVFRNNVKRRGSLKDLLPPPLSKSRARLVRKVARRQLLRFAASNL